MVKKILTKLKRRMVKCNENFNEKVRNISNKHKSRKYQTELKNRITELKTH